jgi:hypothetical protein
MNAGLRLSEPRGPHDVTMRDVRGPDTPELRRVLELFWTIFPEYRRYAEYVRVCAQRLSREHPQMVGHVWAVCAGGGGPLEAEQIIGFQIFNYLRPTAGPVNRPAGFGVGAFRGLLGPYQHGGVGAWMLRGALEQLALDATLLGDPAPLGHLVEVQPLDGEQARAEFSRKTGSLLVDCAYLEPPMLRGVSYASPAVLRGTAPNPMQLIFYPASPTLSLTQGEVCALLRGLYLDYYRLPSDDPLLSQALRSVFTAGKNSEPSPTLPLQLHPGPEERR